MTIAPRPFALLLLASVAACGGGAAASPGISTAPESSADGLEGLRDSLAALVMPPAEGNLLRDQLAEAVDLRGALGEEADDILQLLADAERAAYPGPPDLEAARSVTDTASDVVSVAYLQAIPLPPGAPPPTLEVMLVLPGFLDSVGRPGPGSAAIDPYTGTATATSGGMTASTTMTTTGSAKIAGSLVTIEITRDTTSSVVVDASGESVLEAEESHTVAVTFDVCPTAEGASIASLEQTATSETTTHAGSQARVGTHSTGRIHSLSRFRGQVDDSATLGQVIQDYSREEKWTRTAAAVDGPEARREGSIDVSYTGIGAGVPSAHPFSPTIGDFSAIEGSVESTGDATQDMVTGTVISAAWDYAEIDQAYVAAQTLWRNSRCVIVAVPEYEAISELDLQLQGHVDHTESVEAGSETPFIADVQHRFGPNVEASLEATLGGDESLEPESIEKPPGTLTYAAPDEEGQTATVRMQSTSRQGIGILAIGFETGVAGYEVTIVRKTSGGGPWDPTTLTFTGVLKPDPDDPTLFTTDVGRASGTVLAWDWEAQTCGQESHNGVVLLVGQIIDGNLTILSLLTDPFIIESGALEGVAPAGGGTARQEREPELASGEAPPVTATCYAWSAISQTTTVKPLAPAE